MEKEEEKENKPKKKKKMKKEKEEKKWKTTPMVQRVSGDCVRARNVLGNVGGHHNCHCYRCY